MSRPGHSHRRDPGARTADYEYHLPPELIAIHPAPKREESRLLVYHRGEDRLEHCRFFDLPEYLGPEDLLVLNDSKVRPAAMATSNAPVAPLRRQPHSPKPPSTHAHTRNGRCCIDAASHASSMAHGTPPGTISGY